MGRVLREYPHQALWPTVGVMQSNRRDRQEAVQIVLERAKVCLNVPLVLNYSETKMEEARLIEVQANSPQATALIRDAERLSSVLLRLADDKTDDKEKSRTFKASVDFPYTKEAFPSRMIMPLQDAMTCTLPSTAETVKSHNPFPAPLVEIRGASLSSSGGNSLM